MAAPKLRRTESLASKRAAITSHERAVASAPRTAAKIKPLVKRAKSATARAGGGRQRRDSHGRFA